MSLLTRINKLEKSIDSDKRLDIETCKLLGIDSDATSMTQVKLKNIYNNIGHSKRSIYENISYAN